MLNKKKKGTDAERELLHMFWKEGWACMRSAGSGSMRYPGPDLLVGNGFRRLSVECKTINDDVKYFSNQDISDLLEFSHKFGAEAWIAIKFKRNDWCFVNPEDLNRTETGYKASIRDIKNRFLLFNEIIEK